MSNRDSTTPNPEIRGCVYRDLKRDPRDGTHGGDNADDQSAGQRWNAFDSLLNPPGEIAKYVSVDDARQLLNAAAFARWRKRPFLVNVTILWDADPGFSPSPKAWIDRQGRLLDRMTKWLNRERIPVAYAWAREISDRHRIPHTHVLLHLPVAHWAAFRAFMIETGGFIDRPKPNSPIEIDGNRYGTKSLPMQAGHLKYLLKGMDQAATFRDPDTYQTTNLMDALRVDNRGEERLPLVGKRIGVSRTIDRLARTAAGWRELTSILDLHRLLNP